MTPPAKVLSPVSPTHSDTATQLARRHRAASLCTLPKEKPKRLGHSLFGLLKETHHFKEQKLAFPISTPFQRSYTSATKTLEDTVTAKVGDYVETGHPLVMSHAVRMGMGPKDCRRCGNPVNEPVGGAAGRGGRLRAMSCPAGGGEAMREKFRTKEEDKQPELHLEEAEMAEERTISSRPRSASTGTHPLFARTDMIDTLAKASAAGRVRPTAVEGVKLNKVQLWQDTALNNFCPGCYAAVSLCHAAQVALQAISEAAAVERAGEGAVKDILRAITKKRERASRNHRDLTVQPETPDDDEVIDIVFSDVEQDGHNSDGSFSSLGSQGPVPPAPPGTPVHSVDLDLEDQQSRKDIEAGITLLMTEEDIDDELVQIDAGLIEAVLPMVDDRAKSKWMASMPQRFMEEVEGLKALIVEGQEMIVDGNRKDKANWRMMVLMHLEWACSALEEKFESKDIVECGFCPSCVQQE